MRNLGRDGARAAAPLQAGLAAADKRPGAIRGTVWHGMQPFVQFLMHPWRRWMPLLQPYTAAEPLAGQFRARQLQAVLRLTPLTMAANALNIVIIAHAFRYAGMNWFLAAWALMVAGLLGLGMRAWVRWKRRRDWVSASRRAMRRATLHAALLAGTWGTMLLVTCSGANNSQQMLLATIATGMVCAGGFALATVPMAGTAYVMVLGTCAGIAFVTSNFPVAPQLSILIVAYTAIVISSVWATARLFGARLMAEAEAERQNEVIGLLLRDFEENSSDVLWEVDAQSHLRHVSPRLERLFGQPARVLQSRPVFDWLRRSLPDDETAATQLLALQTQMATGQPFRDLLTTTKVGAQTRWWQNSAKPLIDAAGLCIGWRGVSTDVTATQLANRQLAWLAHFDALTGLANRHQFRSRLDELLGNTGLPPRPFALLCLDLDHFKTVNDTLGHAVGDGLLQAVAQRLREATRRGDTVARLGGDEFAAVLVDTASIAEAQALTERVLENLSTPCDVQGSRIAARASIGVAMAPRDGTDIDALLSNADLALYAAKSAGRGTHRFFAPDMAAVTRRRLLLEQALREALPRGELRLAFQPQVDLKHWRVIGFEALLRWRHAELGDVSPVEFIPIAEEAGLIVEIGAWVLAEACREAARWPGELKVSVNVSPAQTRTSDLCGVVAKALAETTLGAQRLELEITESIFLNENSGALDVLHGLRKLGARVALDDFGTGYSALAYLRRFPFDTLKIDRSFVRELMQRRDARAIVRMILGLARTLHMTTVAEGVEEPAQAGLLTQHGCDAMQGFLVAHPLEADDVVEFLVDWQRQPRVPAAESLMTLPMPLEPAR